MLPPGQKARSDFPRFGLPPYATRFPSSIASLSIDIQVNDGKTTTLDLSSIDVPRCTIQSDFHCVTTWSYLNLQWSGTKFSDLFDKYVRQLIGDDEKIAGAVFYAQDGYKTSLPLTDLLAGDALLADSLDGKPLSIEHGAPLRLVVPAHYGYKNIKHLSRIEFYSTLPKLKKGTRAFLDHPRARVSKEERGRWVPGWILRFIYRPMISGTVKNFKTAMKKHQTDE